MDWFEPNWWYDFVVVPLLKNGQVYNDIMELDTFEALTLLYAFNRRSELESAAQWKSQESPPDDPLNMRKKGKEPVNVEQVRQWVAKG